MVIPDTLPLLAGKVVNVRTTNSYRLEFDLRIFLIKMKLQYKFQAASKHKIVQQCSGNIRVQTYSMVNRE